MVELPMLFADEMVRSILGGRKSQTRRVVKKANSLINHRKPVTDDIGWNRCAWDREFILFPSDWGVGFWVPDYELPRRNYGISPRVNTYTRFWVREACSQDSTGLYRADILNVERSERKWTAAMFMPRKLCRIILQVTGVRPERLWDISTADVAAEGFDSREELRTLWDAHHVVGRRWDDNPIVWVYEFVRTDGGIEWLN